MPDLLAQGREFYGQRAWDRAYRSLALADQTAPLGGEDLERLAIAAYLTGREEEFAKALERAHQACLAAGDGPRAARAAFWLALRLLLRGEAGHSTGWLARARRLTEQRDCAERGYLLLPEAEQALGEGDCDVAYAIASDAAAIGARFREADLIACARHLQGRALVRHGRLPAGLALLDEAMLAATAGELSPLMTGLIYCSVIDACQQAYALDRAREWTTALAGWCAQQPEMVAFTDVCLVHRAEILQRHGAWQDALDEAERACRRFSQGLDEKPPAGAFYRQAEVHRLRGNLAAAEQGYRRASEWGWEPQPGLALLRLAQGRADAAAAAIRRALDATTDRLERARLLPALVEIMLVVGDLEAARDGCRELGDVTAWLGTDVLEAMAAQARGAVALAGGDARQALASLRRAREEWQQLDAPYDTARARVLLGLACRALGDEDGAALELGAARTAFERLGAAVDLARVAALASAAPLAPPHKLTRRELEVLRLVATGKTNKAIAAELGLSEKTVDRHVSNIFTKLDVPSRAAATAYAYRHKLV